MNSDEKTPNDRKSENAPFLEPKPPAFSETLSYPERQNGVNDSLEKAVTAKLIETAESIEPVSARSRDPIEIPEVVKPYLHQASHPSLAQKDTGVSDGTNSSLVFQPPPIPQNMENVAAVGGAVGAMVLGVWSIIGSLITPWSVVNSLLGFLLGMWGTTSRHRRWSIIGIVLCLIGLFLSAVQINEIIHAIFRARASEEDL
jgi:hypothetical protein